MHPHNPWQELYEHPGLTPWVHGDAARGFPLRNLLQGLGEMLGQLNGLLFPEGRVPWSNLLDVESAEDGFLPWLTQLAAVPERLQSPELLREQIRIRAGIDRGKTKTIAAAAALYLSGTRSVFIQEQTISAYHFTVTVFDTEVPPSDALGTTTIVRDQVVRAKPVGLVLDFQIVPEWSFGSLSAQFADFAAVTSHFSDFADITNGL